MAYPDPHCEPDTEVVSFSPKLKISVAVLIAVFAVSYWAPLAPLHDGLTEYFSLIWWAVLLGLLIGGLIDHFVPDGFIFKYLGSRSPLALPYAVIAGFLLSACSHGILAIAIQLYKKGAAIPSVVTFLLASPWANFPVTILLFGFFGWQAFLFIGAAMLIALVTGLAFFGLEKKGWIEPSASAMSNDDYSWHNLRHFDLGESITGVYRGSVHLANMVLWWIIVGFLAAALIKAYVPHEMFMEYFGPSFSGLILTLLAATIIEICSEGSSPIAFEIFNKVGTLGNPFVFLMAGVVTDYTEIGLLWTNIGKRTAIWLPIITVPQVLFLGYLFNQL